MNVCMQIDIAIICGIYLIVYKVYIKLQIHCCIYRKNIIYVATYIYVHIYNLRLIIKRHCFLSAYNLLIMVRGTAYLLIYNNVRLHCGGSSSHRSNIITDTLNATPLLNHLFWLCAALCT